MLPLLGAIIILGAIVLGAAAARPEPQPIPVKRPRR